MANAIKAYDLAQTALVNGAIKIEFSGGQRQRLAITHNMQVVETMADDILVMQAGQIVEAGGAQDVLHQPQHAYTQALLAGRL